MLSLLDKPIVTSQDTENPLITYKTAYLLGNDPLLDEVMKKRQTDKHCHQAPRKKVPTIYHVRVEYGVADGQPFFDEIFVKLGKRWFPFINDDTDETKLEKLKNFHPEFYFLNEEKVGDAECVQRIEKYEESQLIAHLNELGPEVFAEEEEYPDDETSLAQVILNEKEEEEE